MFSPTWTYPDLTCQHFTHTYIIGRRNPEVLYQRSTRDVETTGDILFFFYAPFLGSRADLIGSETKRKLMAL